jgi:queuosine biosynthesis protein QueD
MPLELFREFTFESARKLTRLPENHKCSRVHGHTFRVIIHVAGDIDADTGWLMDFSELDSKINQIREQLDHGFLNDIPGLENPTTENIARWIWNTLKPGLVCLSRVVIQENPFSGCIYTGD